MSSKDQNPDKDLFQFAEEGKKDEFETLVPEPRGEQPKQEQGRELVGAGGPAQPVGFDPKDRKKLETAYILTNAYANIMIRKGLITQRELDAEVEVVMKEFKERGM